MDAFGKIYAASRRMDSVTPVDDCSNPIQHSLTAQQHDLPDTDDHMSCRDKRKKNPVTS
jgi:hypothetical protein